MISNSCLWNWWFQWTPRVQTFRELEVGASRPKQKKQQQRNIMFTNNNKCSRLGSSLAHSSKGLTCLTNSQCWFFSVWRIYDVTSLPATDIYVERLLNVNITWPFSRHSCVIVVCVNQSVSHGKETVIEVYRFLLCIVLCYHTNCIRYCYCTFSLVLYLDVAIRRVSRVNAPNVRLVLFSGSGQKATRTKGHGHKATRTKGHTDKRPQLPNTHLPVLRNTAPAAPAPHRPRILYPW